MNPVRRALEKTIRRVRSRLATARNRLAEALQQHHRDTATRLEADANALAAELDQLKQQRAHTLTHVRAGDLPEQDKLDALPVGGRLFLDLVRMIAYRAETRMMAPVITTQGKKPNARRLLRALLTSDANIIPVPAKGILRIQLLGLGRQRASGYMGQAEPVLERRLRPHARSPGRGTQCNPHHLSRHRSQARLRVGRRSAARSVT